MRMVLLDMQDGRVEVHHNGSELEDLDAMERAILALSKEYKRCMSDDYFNRQILPKVQAVRGNER